MFRAAKAIRDVIRIEFQDPIYSADLHLQRFKQVNSYISSMSF